jgi:hypothetical protein
MAMNIHDFLDNYLPRTVVYCVGDKNVTEMIQNMIMSHSAHTGSEIILFALDKEIADALRDFCPTVDYYGEKKITNMYFQKLVIANEILNRNKIAIFVDADCIIQNGFKLDMVEQYITTGADAHVQSVEHKEWLGDGVSCGTGILSLRPTERTKNLFSEEYLIRTDHNNYGDDQGYFNKHIKENNILEINYLDKDLYPNGNHYHQNTERVSKVFKIFHVTNLYGYEDMDTSKNYVGTEAKIKSMKHLKYWYIP